MPLPSRTAILTAIVAALVGGFLYLAASSEIYDLATSGGVRELRDTLRTIRGETRVLLVGLDGVGAPILYEALEKGRMPHVAALLGAPVDSTGLWEHAYGSRDVPSVLPAETTAGWAAVLTGARPADSGVPGNEWFVRDSLAFYAPVPLSVNSYAHTLDIYTDGLVGKRVQVPTLFERVPELRSHVALGFVSRGADLLTPPDFDQLPRLLQSLLDAALGRENVDEELYEMLDRTAVAGVRKAAEAHGLPDLQFVYFPGIDLLTHASESPIDRQRTYLADVIDPAVGDVLEVYRNHGALEQTYVLLVADHGHTPHLRDADHALDEEPLALLDTVGLRVRAPSVGRDDAGTYNAVLAANEAFGYLYLADRSTCPTQDDVCDWISPPRLDEDILPVARALRDAGAYVPGMANTIDLIFVRESPTGPYHVLDGDSLVALGPYLARNPRPDLWRFEERLGWLVDGCCGHHAGDIAILARGGPDVPIDQRYYFAPPHHSGHGGVSRQDGAIPLLLAQTRTSGADLRDAVHEIVGTSPTQLSVTPLVQGLLERNALATGGPIRP